MKTSTDLANILNGIHRKSYPAYKSLKGCYHFGKYTLSIDHVQGDPFASPSNVSILIPSKTAGFPSRLYDTAHMRIALQDYLTRVFKKQIESYNFKAKGSGKSGLLAISKCDQEILLRSCCTINPSTGDILAGIEIGFPANGRTINAIELSKILFDFLPKCILLAFVYQKHDPNKVEQVHNLAEDQQYIREQLDLTGLIAFVANNSLLPRETGISTKPMKRAVPFVSPTSLEVTFTLPHYGKITGMGVPEGITLIVGGGYHGKSTLLKALETGVYNHIAGDGREYVITNQSAVKIRSEDGRSVKKTDISMFINNLPCLPGSSSGKDTTAFYTEDASGSTSQAANVIEAIEAGASLLLIDEDTSATNFMIRDELMQQVVHRNQEPITPFIERILGLYTDFGISTILVAGSSGSFFHIADHIIQMDQYIPKDITASAKSAAANYPMTKEAFNKPEAPSFDRRPKPSPAMKRDQRLKIKASGRDTILINKDTVNLHYLEQLIDSQQTLALGYMLRYAERHLFDGQKNLYEVIEELLLLIEQKGLTYVSENNYLCSNLALPRRQEIFACFNRYRGLNI